MSYLTERFKNSATLPVDVDWDEILPHCRNSPAPQICAAEFDLAIRSGEAQVRSQLQWCYERTGAASICLRKLGVALGLSAMAKGAGGAPGDDPRSCLDGIRGDARWSQDAPEVVRACIGGLLAGVTTYGVPDDELAATVCALVVVATCPEIVKGS